MYEVNIWEDAQDYYVVTGYEIQNILADYS